MMEADCLEVPELLLAYHSKVLWHAIHRGSESVKTSARARYTQVKVRRWERLESHSILAAFRALLSASVMCKLSRVR